MFVRCKNNKNSFLVRIRMVILYQNFIFIAVRYGKVLFFWENV